jgi:hypothetical protein
MRFNSLRLNHSKCELVGRASDGQNVTAAAIAASGINIEGHPIVPLEHDKPIRCLGVHCTFNGDWKAQHHKSTAMLMLFQRVVSKFKLSVSQASYMFNTFLLPKLELALRYITGRHVNDWIKSYYYYFFFKWVGNSMSIFSTKLRTDSNKSNKAYLTNNAANACSAVRVWDADRADK